MYIYAYMWIQPVNIVFLIPDFYLPGQHGADVIFRNVLVPIAGQRLALTVFTAATLMFCFAHDMVIVYKRGFRGSTPGRLIAQS